MSSSNLLPLINIDRGDILKFIEAIPNRDKYMYFSCFDLEYYDGSWDTTYVLPICANYDTYRNYIKLVISGVNEYLFPGYKREILEFKKQSRFIFREPFDRVRGFACAIDPSFRYLSIGHGTCEVFKDQPDYFPFVLFDLSNRTYRKARREVKVELGHMHDFLDDFYLN